MKPFDKKNNWIYPIAILLAVGFAYMMAAGGIAVGMIFFVLPPIVVFLIISFSRPYLLMHVIIAMGFLISVLGRYLPGGIPFGLTVDGLLVLIFIILAFDKNVSYDKDATFNPLTLALLAWFLLTLLEVVNPLARSKVAWFYAMRGLSFYPVMLAIMTIYVFNKKAYLKQFLLIWAGFELVGTLWGMKQLFLGVSAVEQAWLNAGAASTHILFGKLRVFSYFSDAAQFGASQAHTALVFGIIGLYPGKLKYRYWILAFAGLALYGMLISGTRGAMGVLALGGFTYFIMTKNFKIVIIGIIAAAGVFVFLKYTTLMQTNYQVNRLRTALRADDPSLMVRKQREIILKAYMRDKPFGGGIGSAGYWGKRFSPGTFLAELGTDGHYTRIWMESGIIGLYVYLAHLATMAFYLGYLLWRMPDSVLRQILVAFFSGFLGLCLASYTNGLLTQIPTGNLLFVSLGLVYLGATGRLK
jgi:hypothetical protein